jgi:hypothetical protein
VVTEVVSRCKNQAPPPWVVFEALADPDRDPYRLWLHPAGGEVRPRIVQAERPHLVVWSSLGLDRPDARLRFDILPAENNHGSDLTWTLFVDDPVPEASQVLAMRKRVDRLINADLRHCFGQ